MVFLIIGCGYKKIQNSNIYCEKIYFECTRKTQLIIFRTSKGNLEVELYGGRNPITVSNFVANIKKDIYKNIKFYKIVNYPQIKLIHSGVYSKSFIYNKENQNLNQISPSIPLEIKMGKESEPRYNYEVNDPSEILNLESIFENGSLAMVKSGKSNSSSTEFFFVTNSFPELDGRYSVFGKVVKGIEILNKVSTEDLIYEVAISN